MQSVDKGGDSLEIAGKKVDKNPEVDRDSTVHIEK